MDNIYLILQERFLVHTPDHSERAKMPGLPSNNYNLIHSEHLALLSRLSQEFNASHDPDELLDRVIGEVIEATCAERGMVILVEPAVDLAQSQEPETIHLTTHTTRGFAPGDWEASNFKVSLSIIEQVARTGKPVLTSDALEDERFKTQQSVIFHQLRSITCVPMSIQLRVIGAIYVDNRFHTGVFNHLDLELLNAIGATAAIAIENARLFSNVQAYLRTLRLLHKISNDLTATLDLERVLHLSVRAIQDLLGATAASILKIKDHELVFEITIGEHANEIKDFRMPIDQGVAGWVIKHQEPVIINDVARDFRFSETADRKSGFNTKSIAAAPLVVNNSPIGVLEVFNKPAGFSQADLDLLETFASSAAIALENAHLFAEAVEKGRMERELQMARNVQTSLLPQQIPDIPGWEFAVQWKPARQVGGDYYDFVPLEPSSDHPDRIGLVIADVTDKGAPAALFMANVRSTIRAACYSAPSPVQGIQHANWLVSADSYSSMFITLLYSQLDPRSGQLTYINAGHNPPLVYSCNPQANQTAPHFLTATGIPLGIDGLAKYEQQTIQLEQGDFIVFYTDGVTDALNQIGEAFGAERFHSVIVDKTSQACSANEILNLVLQTLLDFIGESEQYDDITILIARRL